MSLLPVVRVALVVFVLAWLFGPSSLRSTVPIWLVFLVALGLEVQFFLGAFRPAPARRPDRGPQAVDKERYGYADWDDEDEDEDPDASEYEHEDEEEDEGPEPRDVRRSVIRLAIGLGVIATLAFVLWIVENRTGWNALDADAQAEAAERFSDEASRIAGKPVTIRCDESGDYVGAVQHSDGVATVGGDVAYLTPERCLDLYRLAFKGEVTSSQTARALAVLAHEAWHLRGLRDEGTTECYALQTGVGLGQRLGLSEDNARQMMRQQLTENALRRGTGLEYLVPAECRNNGRLDLNPASSPFP
jgi:hypothetical protein